MGSLQLLDLATEAFSDKVVRDGMDPKTMISLLVFYIMNGPPVGTDEEMSESFYAGLKEDFGAECMNLVEEYVMTARAELRNGVKL